MIKKTIKYFTVVLLLIYIGCASFQPKAILKKEKAVSVNGKQYFIQDVLIKMKDGATNSAIIVRKNEDSRQKPVILQYTIYAKDHVESSLFESVDNGYIGVMAYSRGKRHSSDEIWPYENDATDAYQVIDWISKQKWCDGNVGMFGGSYNGFTQWAATKKLHPALKTIVPYVANRPGMGLPMENNIFINPNYEWSFYVGNNKFLDTLANDRQHTRQMTNTWWESGLAYEKMDSLVQKPNKWFQRWIDHPSFDKYWQNMAPYKEEFANIKIPVLTIDGYYNDSQNSSLYFLREHYNYNPNAEHYLIIGPYNHFGAQRGGNSYVNGYQVNQKALFNINQLTYQWFDYVLKDKDKPKMLHDKINYFVMEANEWRSAPSINKMKNDHLKLYLIDEKLEDFYTLSEEKPNELGFINQSVDFSNRTSMNNNNCYPDPLLLEDLNLKTGFAFMSEPIQESIVINGAFEGEIIASINKKDMDIGITLFELLPSGEYFHLSYTIFRASYSKDITTRNLLTPNVLEKIPFSNTHLISKQIKKGSRLVVNLDVSKDPYSQLNYGTGKDVSKETIKDAKEPLQIKWYSDSYIKIPIFRNNQISN